jgi:hypothetical protein
LNEINVVRSPYAEELRAEERLAALVDLLRFRYGDDAADSLVEQLSMIQNPDRLRRLFSFACSNVTLDMFGLELNKPPT